MKLFLLFVAAQMMGNSIACFIAAAVWHFTRPRLVDIGKASRLDPPRYSYAGTPLP